MRKKTWRLRCVRRSNVLTELIRRHSFLFLRPCEFRSRWKKREREISSIFDPLFPQSTLSLLFKHVLLMHRAYCLLPCLSTHSISYIYIYIFIVDQETDQSHRSNRYLKRILLYNSIRSIIRSPWIFLNSSRNSWREKRRKRRKSHRLRRCQSILVLIDNSPQRSLNRISILESIFEDK